MHLRYERDHKTTVHLQHHQIKYIFRMSHDDRGYGRFNIYGRPWVSSPAPQKMLKYKFNYGDRLSGY